MRLLSPRFALTRRPKHYALGARVVLARTPAGGMVVLEYRSGNFAAFQALFYIAKRAYALPLGARSRAWALGEAARSETRLHREISTGTTASCGICRVRLTGAAQIAALRACSASGVAGNPYSARRVGVA